MAKKKAAEKVSGATVPKIVFTKRKLLTSSKYANRRDLLSAVLENGKTYTMDQVDGLIEKFMTKGKVK